MSVSSTPIVMLHACVALCDTTFFMVSHFLVRGRVQGVGFRWFVHREAAELGLRGSVRNTDSGEVEVIAAGNPDLIADLRAHLHKGSRGSRVDAVIEHELAESEAEALEAFKIEGAW
ncbi:MAG: acylphosphatase [Janthinobacterium lividum]